MTIRFSTRLGTAEVPATFTAMRFPAGEAHVKADNGEDPELTEIARLYGADGNDLITLAMWADACRQRDAHTVAFIPYLPGARQDRGLPFGAQVYANLIRSMGIDQIVCFDPHSPVMPSLIGDITIIDSAPIIRKHVVGRADSDEHPQRYTGIIAPDAGAVARASRAATACHLPLYKAEKHRNSDTGKLSDFTCEPLPADGKYLVVDDICDGGGTFRGLADATGLPKSQLGLWVSHGVFSGSSGLLIRYYDEIWTTDSFREDADARPHFKTIPIQTYLNAAIQ